MDKEFTVHVVPHTHWDREWYFTFEEFRYRLVKMFDRLLALMQSGEITYFTADGHTLLIDDYLEIRPEREEELRALIRDGRILIGPWFTQPNVYMSDAEAQIRNLLRGREEMKKYGDTMAMAPINYLPDMFGYHAQLPQIMKGFGMTHLVGARGMPLGSPNYFKWQGSDGSVVKVCSLLNSYNNGNGLSDREEPKEFKVFGESIVMPSLPDILKLVLDDRSETARANSPQLLLMNGVDHMWANPHMKRTLAKIEQLRPELKTRQSTLAQYISAVENTLEQELELYTGEHRDPRQVLILPGSQSTRMDVKKMNRHIEDLLERRVEPMMARMMALGEQDLPFALLKKAWEYVLMNQAHDSLCCANAEASYREILARYEKADDIAREIHTELEQRLFRRLRGEPGECVMVYNPTPAEREEPMHFDIIAPHDALWTQPHLYDGEREVPVYVQSVREDMLLRYVPSSGLVGQLHVRIFHVTAEPGVIAPTGYKVLEVKLEAPHAKSVSGICTGPRTLENEFLQVQINADGTLDVLDKQTGRRFAQVHQFIDEGEAGCGFMHTAPLCDSVCLSAGKDLSVQIQENNPLKGTFCITQTMSVPEDVCDGGNARSSRLAELFLKTEVTLRKGCRAVEFETIVHNTAKSHRLRIGFPTDIDSGNSYSGLPFDVIRRPVQPENVNVIEPGAYEAYCGYHPMHDFCGISDGAVGAALTGNGFLEFEVLPMRRTLCMTMIRATEHLHVGVLYHGSKFKIPAAQLQGEQRYRYAFVPHSGDYENALEQVEAFRHPLYSVQKDFLEEESMPDYVAPVRDLNWEGEFIHVAGDCVLTAIKPAEDGDGIIVRMYNPLERDGEARLRIADGFHLVRAARVRLDETELEELSAANHCIHLTAQAKQILTLRLHMVTKPIKNN